MMVCDEIIDLGLVVRIGPLKGNQKQLSNPLFGRHGSKHRLGL
jgi:hypothetical protein